MKNEGLYRKTFFLSGPPPKTYSCKTKYKHGVVNLFEPYQEALPLEAGYYSFVIDERGRFRVNRGNTSSHGGFVGGRSVGAAGHFEVTRAGKVGRVVCISSDYWMRFADERNVTVRYVVTAFQHHHAFEVSRHAYFTFSRGIADNFHVSRDGHLVLDMAERRGLLAEEEQGTEERHPFSPPQIESFRRYLPQRPPRFYEIKQDHLANPMDYDDHELIEAGPFMPPFSPADGRLTSGRKAFVFDFDGWLIVGQGHHLLSGGNPVGSAGQIYVDGDGVVTEINLNFSGHYRPPLSAGYARYTYRSLVSHPLLTFAPGCRISARKSFRLDMNLETMVFTADELLSDEPSLDYALDGMVDDDDVFSPDVEELTPDGFEDDDH